MIVKISSCRVAKLFPGTFVSGNKFKGFKLPEYFFKKNTDILFLLTRARSGKDNPKSSKK
jgi:hypothetical protein